MSLSPDAERPAADVRRATDRDVRSLLELRRAWAEEQAGRPVYDPGFEDAFLVWWRREREQRVTWLASVAGAGIGMLNLRTFHRMPKPGRPVSRWGYVANVFVLARYRDRGVGAALVDAAAAYADEQGYVRLVLSPSPGSVPLYARAGFAPATELLVRRLR